MKKSRKASRPALTSAAVLMLMGAGCSANLNFNSPSPLGAGVSGKYWQTPYFVDTPLFTPGAQLTPQTNKNFATATSGTNVQLVGTWWDASTPSTYRGYGRLYQDGVGWSSLGPAFGQLAANANDFVQTSVATGPGGQFLATFFNPGSSVVASTVYSGSAWQPTLQNNPIAISAAQTVNAPSVMDFFGRGYVFMYDGATVNETQWSLVGGLSTSVHALLTTGLNPNTQLTADFDGAKQVCVTYETDVGLGFSLFANCQDVTLGGTFDFITPLTGATVTAVDTGVNGHVTATDGAGKIMAVYYKSTGTTFHTYASLATNGVWAAPIQLDVLSAIDGFNAPNKTSGLWPDGTKPGIAYVGSGRFLAAWTGFNTALTPPATQIYSILYDPANGGWQGAQTPAVPGSLQAVPGTYEQYNSIPHPQHLTVFGNSWGNAGIAINNIFTTDYIPGPNPVNIPGSNPPVAFLSVYPEAAEVRITVLDRWQQDNGWLTPTAYTPTTATQLPGSKSFTCFKSWNGAQAANGSGGDTDCTAYPQGIILPSGDTLVFFQAQDNYANGSVAGNRRIAVSEFK